MLLVWGKTLHGSTDEGAGTRIATVFNHLWFIPLIPERSVVLIKVPGGEELLLPLARYDRRSLILGWAPVLFPAVSLVVALPVALLLSVYAGALVVACAFGAAAWLHVRAWRSTTDDFDWQRRARSRWLGAPIDASMPVFDPRRAAEALHAFMEAHLRDNPIDYRAATFGQQQIGAALDDRMVDVDFLIASATLTEVTTREQGPSTTAKAIWDKVLVLCPQLRDAPAHYWLFGIEGAYPVYRKPAPDKARLLWAGALGLIGLGVLSLGHLHHERHTRPRFAVAVPSGSNLRVEIDGEPVTKSFQPALGGGEWLDLSLEAGTHFVTVKDGGAVVDERRVDVEAGADGYVFVAKGSSNAWCAYREKVHYGRSAPSRSRTLVARAGEAG